MTKTDYEPLIDKIRNRFLSWASKTLSYAGRLQLIQSVIVSTANFWCSAFRLPNKCLQQIESMAAAFLWSGSPHKTTQAKVSWEDVCGTKKEGGLGIRRLKDSSTVFSLKLIWRLFVQTDTLWVDWVHKYLLRNSSFWEISDKTTRGNWMWKLLKLRPIAAKFLKTEIKDGKSTFFWYDKWLDIGPLYEVVAAAGTRVLGVQQNAKVADAVRQA